MTNKLVSDLLKSLDEYRDSETRYAYHHKKLEDGIKVLGILLESYKIEASYYKERSSIVSNGGGGGGGGAGDSGGSNCLTVVGANATTDRVDNAC